MRVKNAILILGTGRSGTSWLHDVFTSHPQYRRIFEPLHPIQVASASKYAGLYLRGNEEEASLYKYLTFVMEDKTDDAWIRWIHLGISKNTKPIRILFQFFYNLPNYKFWAKNRVVKFIQANLLVSWLDSNFPYKIVFVIREPFSVIQSQLNMGWSSDLDIYIKQPKIRDFFQSINLDELSASLKTVEERLAARWCIENLIAISEITRTKNPDKVIPVTYEKLIEGENVFLLLKHIGYSRREILKIKRNCRVREKYRSTKRKSTSNQKLDEKQKELIENVLSTFGIDSYQTIVKPFNSIFTMNQEG